MNSSTRRCFHHGTIRHRLTSVVSLALWRWRQHWFLLLLMGVGMLAAVTLVCILPLLTVVLQTAGLLDTLTASPSDSELTLHAPVMGLSSQMLDVIDRYASSPFQDHLTKYLLDGQPRLEIQTPDLSITAPEQSMFRTPLRLYGNPIDETAPHLVLAQGRLPRPASNAVEIAVTPETAGALHVRVGSVMTVVSNFSIVPDQGSASGTIQPLDCSVIPTESNPPLISQQTYCQQIKLDVVGLFEVKTNDHFWHGEDFRPTQDTIWHYNALVSNQALLTMFDHIAGNYAANAVYFLEGYYANLTWYYYLDPLRVSIDRLNDLIDQLSATQEAVNQTNTLIRRSYQSVVQQFDLQSPVLSNSVLPGSLESFRSRNAIARIPVAILTLQITCLLLFFVSLMTGLLVERQANTIAMLRSRGASTGQIFGAHITQGLVLSLLTLVAGPLLAYTGVVAIARRILPANAQDALKVLSADPPAALLHVKWYAIVTAGVIVVVLITALYRASRIHAPTLRSESGRRAWRPLWQRLDLDLVAAITALTGYGIAVYLADTRGLLDAHTQALVSAPVSLIAPVFLLLAAVLLFLRCSPLLFRIASRFLARGRGAVPMLSVTQLSPLAATIGAYDYVARSCHGLLRVYADFFCLASSTSRGYRGLSSGGGLQWRHSPHCSSLSSKRRSESLS